MTIKCYPIPNHGYFYFYLRKGSEVLQVTERDRTLYLQIHESNRETMVRHRFVWVCPKSRRRLQEESRLFLQPVATWEDRLLYERVSSHKVAPLNKKYHEIVRQLMLVLGQPAEF